MEINEQLRRGEGIRLALFSQKKKQSWLIKKLMENGVVADPSLLSNSLSGFRHGPKADTIIETAEEILGIRR